MFFAMLYEIVKPLFRLYYRLVFGMKVTGRDTVPKEGNFVCVCNHISNNDPIVVGSFLPRRVNYLGKAELFNNKFAAWVLRGVGVIPVHRDAAEFSVFKLVVKLLKEGKTVVIFPEGSRVTEQSQSNAKSGAVAFAIKAKVPLLPAHISGRYKIRGRMHLTFGKPVHLDKYYDEKLNSQMLAEITKNVMDDIYNLGE